MTFKVQDFVKETSSFTGTGDILCGGAVSGYVAFSSYLSDTYTTIYTVALGTQWETGIGIYNSGANSITRSKLLSSSTGSAVSFSAGTKTVICGFASQLYANVQINDGTFSSGTQTIDASILSHKFTVGGAFTLAIAHWGPSGTLSEVELEITNAAAFTMTLPTITWLKGDGTSSTTFSSIGVTLQASGKNLFCLWTTDGGATVYGRAA